MNIPRHTSRGRGYKGTAPTLVRGKTPGGGTGGWINWGCHTISTIGKLCPAEHAAACIPEVCAGLKFVSGSRQGVEISARLPARLPGDLQFLVPAWSRGKNFLSMSGPGPGQVPANKTLVPAVPACPSRPGIRESRICSSMNLSCLSMFSWN